MSLNTKDYYSQVTTGVYSEYLKLLTHRDTLLVPLAATILLGCTKGWTLGGGGFSPLQVEGTWHMCWGDPSPRPNRAHAFGSLSAPEGASRTGRIRPRPAPEAALARQRGGGRVSLGGAAWTWTPERGLGGAAVRPGVPAQGPKGGGTPYGPARAWARAPSKS